MKAVKTVGTGPELVVRGLVRSLGARWRVGRGLPGTPDLANRRAKWAIQVFGCWWHCHGCRAGRLPTKDRAWWRAKFERNKARDARTGRELRRLGFRVLTLWECDVRRKTPSVARRIARFLLA